MSEDNAVPRGFLVVDDHVLDILSGMDGKVLSILCLAFSVSADILLCPELLGRSGGSAQFLLSVQ
ncbi:MULTISPECIES: hypothetical protein [Halobacteriales]|uniref:hypothetical protein n=1 Tax=Halobacteriales TaxID=2235 RepID=UPI0012E009B4|nr:hypothetical protein [Haloglomus halophilum]